MYSCCRFEDKINSAASNVYRKSGLKWIAGKLQNNPIGRAVFYGASYDVHDVTKVDHKDYDANVVAIWENAEVFDWRTERLFRYIQVFSACVMRWGLMAMSLHASCFACQHADVCTCPLADDFRRACKDGDTFLVCAKPPFWSFLGCATRYQRRQK